MRSQKASASLLGLALGAALTSVGIKAGVGTEAPPIDPASPANALASHFAAQGFAVRTEFHAEARDMVFAESAGCRLAARPLPQGDQIDDFRLYSAQLPRLRFRLDGQWYADYPGLRAAWLGVIADAGRQLRLRTSAKPAVLVVATNAGCNLADIGFDPPIASRALTPQSRRETEY